MLRCLLGGEVELVHLQILWHQAILLLAQPLPAIVKCLLPGLGPHCSCLCCIFPHVVPVADFHYPTLQTLPQSQCAHPITIFAMDTPVNQTLSRPQQKIRQISDLKAKRPPQAPSASWCEGKFA